MGPVTMQGAHASARPRRRLENYSSDLFGFRHLDQRDPAAPDLQRKTLYQQELALTARDSNCVTSPGADGRSHSSVFCEPPKRDALRNSLTFDGQGGSAQAAEGALVDRILSGHKELFMDLVRPHQRTVYAMALSLLANKEDAEDVTQDTLLKALARLHQFRRESAFGTWLIQIAINEARMRNRRQWHVPMLSLNRTGDDDKEYVPADFEDWREIPSTILERAEVREALIKALGSLQLHYREAFVLRDIHELSISETSAVLGISPGAVKTRLRRARLMLRDILATGLGKDGRLGWIPKEVRKTWE